MKDKRRLPVKGDTKRKCTWHKEQMCKVLAAGGRQPFQSLGGGGDGGGGGGGVGGERPSEAS